MPYIDGFVLAVPTANKDKFVAHANLGDSVLMDQGATRIVECWQEDVPKGETTDFFGAVQAKDDEAVCFSWVEWPDKATRDTAMGKIEELMATDDRMSPEKNPMPFDGQRMIWGGFEPIVSEGSGGSDSYVQGFIVPVPKDKREAYRKVAADMWPMFEKWGARRLVEAWGDDVPEGKQTDFQRSVKATADENVVFSLIEWPSREVCDAAHAKMMEDPNMGSMEMPFDGKRMVYGGFSPVVELGQPS